MQMMIQKYDSIEFKTYRKLEIYLENNYFIKFQERKKLTRENTIFILISMFISFILSYNTDTDLFNRVHL